MLGGGINGSSSSIKSYYDMTVKEMAELFELVEDIGPGNIHDADNLDSAYFVVSKYGTEDSPQCIVFIANSLNEIDDYQGTWEDCYVAVAYKNRPRNPLLFDVNNDLLVRDACASTFQTEFRGEIYYEAFNDMPDV